MTKRDFSRYERLGASHFGSIDEFLSNAPGSGPITIDYHGSPLDLLIRLKKGADTTMVLFHPAVTNDTVTRPYFVGFGLTDLLNVNAVFVADPGLEIDDDLRIAWFAGNTRQRLQDDLPKILRHIMDVLGTKNTIFYGASAGGFAALYYSSHFPGSLVVSVNPQTRITEYFDYLYQPYALKCWGATSTENVRETLELSTSTDLLKVYRKWPGNTVLYIQNDSDWHVEKHMKPFFSAVPRKRDLYQVIGNWGDGHVPAPKKLQILLLAAVIETNGQWTKSLDSLPGVQRVEPKPRLRMPWRRHS